LTSKRSYIALPKIRVASINELPEDKGLVVEAEGNRLALFSHQGKFFAIDEICPHRGGPLHEGVIQDGVVACPLHLWQFDLKSGISPVNPLSKVRTYRVWCEDDDLFVEV
jgi:NAD(P)H-dependent nitrite reductase small subunit